jgi:hypothetical protein
MHQAENSILGKVLLKEAPHSNKYCVIYTKINSTNCFIIRIGTCLRAIKLFFTSLVSKLGGMETTMNNQGYYICF